MSIGQLQDEVRQRISTVASQTTIAEDRRALLARIQGDMAQLRAKVRDLELLAEEQETCADLPDAHPTCMRFGSLNFSVRSTVHMKLPSTIHRAEESDAVVAMVTQHKRRYEELQKGLREANLEVCLPI